MKKLFLLPAMMTLAATLPAQTKVEWVVTSPTMQWKIQRGIAIAPAAGNADVEIERDQPQQAISGFGTCFNELGWTSLSLLSEKDREGIMKELFAPGVGAAFTLCRMPVGANDFSRNWYSYNETVGDFAMKAFSVANDDENTGSIHKSCAEVQSLVKALGFPLVAANVDEIQQALCGQKRAWQPYLQIRGIRDGPYRNQQRAAAGEGRQRRYGHVYSARRILQGLCSVFRQIHRGL